MTPYKIQCRNCERIFTIKLHDDYGVFRFCPICGQRTLYSLTHKE